MLTQLMDKPRSIADSTEEAMKMGHAQVGTVPRA